MLFVRFLSYCLNFFSTKPAKSRNQPDAGLIMKHATRSDLMIYINPYLCGNLPGKARFFGPKTMPLKSI